MKPKLFFILAAAAAPVFSAPAHPPSELRVLLQREKAAAPAPPPRQLTEVERAELRRQLGAFHRLAQPRP